jgi:hypothetical protein
MKNQRSIARWVGILYIIGTVSGAIGMVGLIGPALGKPELLPALSMSENQLGLGVLLYMIMGFSLAMIPILCYPILKQVSSFLAKGFILFRSALEMVGYIVGALPILYLAVLGETWSKDPSSDQTSFLNLAHLLIGGMDRTAGITSIVFAFGGIMFYWMLYKARLIPRWISGWGLLGLLLYIVAGVFALLGNGMESLYMPLALQEMVMAVWLIVKGFRPEAIAALED